MTDAVSTYEDYTSVMLDRLKQLGPCILPGGKGQPQIIIGAKYTKLSTIKGEWPVLRTGDFSKYEEWSRAMIAQYPNKFSEHIIVYQRKLRPGSMKGVYKGIGGDVVYFIGCDEMPYIKIGTTNDIDKRLAGIQTSVPYDIDVLFVIPGDRSQEKKTHEAFDKYRKRGEWFIKDGKLKEYIEYMMNTNNRYLEPWEFCGTGM